MALNPKQREFVAAYIGPARKNATEAARLAGYAQPHSQGSRLLENVEIQQAIEEHLAEVRSLGIASAAYRVDALKRRHQLMEQVIAERAADEFVSDVPGGGTGLIVKQLKKVTHIFLPDPDDEDGKVSRSVEDQWEAAIDTGLLRELREHEKQIAQELGEWTERKEILGNADQPLVIRSISVPLPTGQAPEPDE